MKNERQNAALWHSATVESVAKALGVDIKTGLSDSEAKSRMRRYGKNRIYREEKTSAASYIAYCASDLMLLLLLLTAAVAAVFGEGEDAALIIPILIVSIVLRTFAYIRARRYIESASSATAVMPSVLVLRGGKVRAIDARDVVKGDIIRLKKGDIVPADCRIISCKALGVYEEGITQSQGITHKEACEIEPGMAPSAWRNMLFAGSSIFSGYSIAFAVETGGDTLAVRTKGELKMVRGGELRITKLLERYSRVWGAVMTLVVFIITGVNLIFAQRGIYDVFFMGLALATASMCEYYSAMGDIAAAAGLSALAKGAGDFSGENGSYVRGVKSIEALSELDAIVFPADGVLVADGVMCRYSVLSGGMLVDSTDADGADELFRMAAVATGLYAKTEGTKERSESVKQIAEYFKKNKYDTSEIYKGEDRAVLFAGVSDGLPFDAQLTYEGEGYTAYLSGNARDILTVSVSILDGTDAVPLSEKMRTQLLSAVSYHEKRGAAVVAVAKKQTPFHSRERMNFVMSDVTLVGIMAFYRSTAPDAENAVAASRESGIRLIMTGEGRGAALLAGRVGIVQKREDMILAKEFSLLDDAGKRAAAETKTLLLGFDAKLLSVFIDLLQRSGKKVAYVADPKHDMTSELRLLHGVGASFAVTHDGIAPEDETDLAENERTDGIAQTLKMRADTIVPRANDGGGGLPTIVECASFAKKIYENVASVAEYLVTSQSARMLMVLYSVLFHTTALGAGQILLWGLIFDFFAVMIIAFERPDYKSLRRTSNVYERLSNPFSGIGRSLAYGTLWGAVTCVVTSLLCKDEKTAATVIFASVILSLIVSVGEHRSEYSVFSRYRRISAAALLFIGASLGLIILCTVMPEAANTLGIISPTPYSLLISVIPPVILLAVYEFDRFLSSNSEEKRK